MRVVVTRPEKSGLKTAELLRARGHDPILLPLTAPVHQTEAATAALAREPAYLAVTSAEAIRALVNAGADLSASLQKPIFVVGQASALAARDAGFQTIITGESDGAALAHLIAEKTRNDVSLRGTICYLAGSPRDAGFEQTLNALNVPFETAEIYQMRQIAWQPSQLQERLTDQPIDAVLFYSSEAVRIFFALLKDEGLLAPLRQSRMICISAKVLSHIPEAFPDAAYASAEPNESQMFDLLERKAGT
jgi:uroporphyrinogen-III synthase